ncbi:MAG: L-dopachrome tautomerase-related protein [Ectothiorhodospiraceae bacterium]|jgi:sugar lactone lactonase YvrE|nr:L-dopachrome tautomerase-related protein [Ectothiorhodospiraceae bacterium]
MSTPASIGTLLFLLLVSPFAAKAQSVPPHFEIVAGIDKAPGNITVTPSGRIIVSLHPFFRDDMRVAEVLRDGSLVPFPNAVWSTGGALDDVLGVQSDPYGIVWMLDTGMRNGLTPKLVGWDTALNRLHRVIHLPPPITVEGSFVNDLAVDRRHDHVYIADPARGSNAALIVVDLATGAARRVLQGHRSVTPEDRDMLVDGKPLEAQRPDGTTVRPRVGVNPLALDVTDEWLYFGPMSGTTLYRVRTADLRNPALDAAALARKVERYGDKAISDGSSMDSAGNVYVTDVTNHAIGYTAPDGYYRLLMSDPRLSWPDAFAYGPDGMLYGVANQLQLAPPFNAGADRTQPPFLIFRFRPLADGVVGR